MTHIGFLYFVIFFLLTIVAILFGIWNSYLFHTWLVGIPFYAIAVFTGYYTIDVLRYYYGRN